MANLVDILDSLTARGELVEEQPDNTVRCTACGHRCLIRKVAAVSVRCGSTRAGIYAAWGYVAALQADPIEKKPFFHVLPGADALTFGMLD